MRKLILFAVFLIVVTTLCSSCNRGMGGWYGNRNLGFHDSTPAPEIQQVMRLPEKN